MEQTPEPKREKKDEEKKVPVIVMTPPPQPGSGPPCIWDNAPTRRTGACWTCILCGATTSC